MGCRDGVSCLCSLTSTFTKRMRGRWLFWRRHCLVIRVRGSSNNNVTLFSRQLRCKLQDTHSRHSVHSCSDYSQVNNTRQPTIGIIRSSKHLCSNSSSGSEANHLYPRSMHATEVDMVPAVTSMIHVFLIANAQISIFMPSIDFWELGLKRQNNQIAFTYWTAEYRKVMGINPTPKHKAPTIYNQTQRECSSKAIRSQVSYHARRQIDSRAWTTCQ
jgi:hypothetical protein